MNSRNYIIIGVIVLLLLGGYLFYTNQASQNNAAFSPTQAQQVVTEIPNTSSSPEQTKNTVENTSSGFVPGTITIKKGETVTWINKDSSSVWVASDPHPTHTGYPGFDAKKEIPTDSEYSFTFEKVGSWGYHNHLNPNTKGTVVVGE